MCRITCGMSLRINQRERGLQSSLYFLERSDVFLLKNRYPILGTMVVNCVRSSLPVVESREVRYAN